MINVIIRRHVGGIFNVLSLERSQNAEICNFLCNGYSHTVYFDWCKILYTAFTGMRNFTTLHDVYDVAI